MHVQRRVHRRVVRLDVHRAGEDGERLALHHELVDAAQLLLGEVLAGLRDDEAVEVVGDLRCRRPSGRRPGTCRRGSSA